MCLVANALCIRWTVVMFWNAVIGMCIILWGNAEKSIYPYFDAKRQFPTLESTTALTMFMRNEDPRAMHDSLRQTGRLRHFRFVLLSDTDRPDIARMEDEGFAKLVDDLSEGMTKSPMYRRRIENIGFKAG